MKKTKTTRTVSLKLLTLIICLFLTTGRILAQLEWPPVTRETKPWSRWWWMGNVLPEEDVSNAMKAYAAAGIGGLEITPIYGVKGYEKKFIDFLSQAYMKKLQYVLFQAEKTGLGIDMATGTGWPFGGPWIGSKDACKYIAYKKYTLKGGENLQEPVEMIQKAFVRSIGGNVSLSDLVEPVSANKNLQALAIEQVRFPRPMPLQLLMGYNESGSYTDLTEKVDSSGKLNWTAPDGNWTLYALFQGWHGKLVERAGPGGEGNVIDHFSETALHDYLRKFDDAFQNHDISSLRAFFNDSYEVDDAAGEADWTPGFLDEFVNRRGYDLRNYLPSLFGDDTTDNKRNRILCDYRQTISELLKEKFTTPWYEWAKSKKALVRNQAHGSPANILDLYGVVDIPECEGEDLFRIKFASSAAHVTGKPLTSSESATWLNEHFLSTLGEVKYDLDRFLLGGVNHIIYHGTTFSPFSESWPGWMFYASVHFGLTNTWWKDFSALNKYVARCQSFLQQGLPDNDILLYFNFYDRISEPGRSMLQHFNGSGRGMTVREAGELLLREGYSYDLISDSQLQNVTFYDNRLLTRGGNYATLVLPETRYLPVELLEHLINLAEEGATIIFHRKFPADVPGYANLLKRQERFKALRNKIHFEPTMNPGIESARTGKGLMLLGEDLNQLLAYAKIKRESMTDVGLECIRRDRRNGNYCYFIANRGKNTVDDWVPLSREAKLIAIFNPVTKISGVGTARTGNNGTAEVYLQLVPGESVILMTYSNPVEGEPYNYYQPAGNPISVKGLWNIEFIEGGPDIPGNYRVEDLKSWTELEGDNVKRFSGTAKYTITFVRPKAKCDGWYLNLGRVAESAGVKINGNDMGIVFSDPFRVFVPDDLLKKTNTLEIEVTNLMANRIAWMDREGINYKKFYNVNFPAKFREDRGKDGLFTAAAWPPRESGLIGPVSLTPVKKLIKE